LAYLTTPTSLSPIRRGLAPGFVNYKKYTVASDRAYQLFVHGRRFSPGTPASSNTKTGRHDIAEKLLKVALNTNKSINQSNQIYDVLDSLTQYNMVFSPGKFCFCAI
jgi:hypothetical protein